MSQAECPIGVGDLQLPCGCSIDVEPRSLRWQSAERLTGGTGPDVVPALSGDDRQLAFTTLHRTVRLWSFPFDPVSGELTGTGVPVTPEDGNLRRFALAGDGRRAAYSFVRTCVATVEGELHAFTETRRMAEVSQPRSRARI